MDNWASGGKMLRAGDVCDHDYMLTAYSCLLVVMSSLFSALCVFCVQIGSQWKQCYVSNFF